MSAEQKPTVTIDIVLIVGGETYVAMPEHEALALRSRRKDETFYVRSAFESDRRRSEAEKQRDRLGEALATFAREAEEFLAEKRHPESDIYPLARVRNWLREAQRVIAEVQP